VLHLLENSDREQIIDLMHSPDVMRIIGEIRAGKDQDHQRRLQTVLRRFSVPRSGAPIKNMGRRTNVDTKRTVADVESRIAAAYTFCQNQRRRAGSAAFPENIEAALVTDFKMPQAVARFVVQSRSRRTAACRIVACLQRRTFEAVKMAATRGAKHPHISR